MDKNNFKYSFIKQCSPTHAICEELRSKLKGFNNSKIGNYEIDTYIFAYHDENNNLIGGLYAYERLGAFHIEFLWVDEAWRGQKLGTKLLREAEECARKNGDLYMDANTGTFQALDFYLKNDFQVFAKLPLLVTDMENQYNYFLVKYL